MQMKGQVTVLDSNNLGAIIADATGEPPAAPLAPPVADAKKPDAADAHDDDKDEPGLTPEIKAVLEKKIERAIGKKHAAMKKAEAFGEQQFNEARAARAELEKKERELERLRAQIQPPKAAEAPKPPERDKFSTQAEYDDAVIDWKVDQRIKAREAEETKKREAEEQQKVLKTAGERIERAKELVPDWEEAVSKAGEAPHYIMRYIHESEMIGELAYHLAKNPDVLAELTKMRHDKGLVAIGKIESKLSPFAPPTGGEKANPAKAKPSVEETTVTTAKEPSQEVRSRPPAPITPINTGVGNAVDKDPREMTYQETRAAWERKNRVSLTARQRH